MAEKLLEKYDSEKRIASLVQWEDDSMTVVVTVNDRADLFDKLDMLTNPHLIKAIDSIRLTKLLYQDSDPWLDSSNLKPTPDGYFRNSLLEHYKAVGYTDEQLNDELTGLI